MARPKKNMATADPEWQKKTRERIKVSQLINRVQDHVFENTELTTTQLRAIEILLDRALPKLSAVEFTGDVEHNAGEGIKEIMEFVATRGSSIRGQ